MTRLAAQSSARASFAAARPCARAPRAASRTLLARATDPAASAKAIEVKDDDFQEKVLDSSLPVLVDFWAPWCGPCRMIAPIIDQIADSMEGQVVCVKLNTDESPEVATKYGIRSIPTVMLFKNGQKLDTIIGAVPKDILMKAVQKVLN